MKMQRFLVPALLACMSLSAVGCVISDADATLTVVNESDYVIDEIYLTEINNPNWGPNLLRGDALFPDETITLAVSCGDYDALVVDEDGVQCEVLDLDLCLNDSTWYFGNNTCTVFNAAKQAPAEARAKSEAAQALVDVAAN